MDADTRAAFEQMQKHLEEMETRLTERIDATETKLLSAFYGWAQPIEKRLRTMPLIDERLGLLEERISALERKNLEKGM